MYYSNKQSLTEDVLCPVNNCHKSIQPELINVVTTQQGGGGLEGDEGVGGLAL